jgi:hypothetical protein
MRDPKNKAITAASGSRRTKSTSGTTSSSRSSSSRSSSKLPEDVRRNTYTADREAGLHVRGLRSS